MPFEARETKFIVFSLRHELYSSDGWLHCGARLDCQGNSTHNQRLAECSYFCLYLLANSNVPDVLEFPQVGKRFF